MSPTIFNDSFASRDAPYNLRNPGSFKTQKVYSVLQWYNLELKSRAYYHGKQGNLYHLVILNPK